MGPFTSPPICPAGVFDVFMMRNIVRLVKIVHGASNVKTGLYAGVELLYEGPNGGSAEGWGDPQA